MSVILISGGLDSCVSTAWALRHTTGPHIPLSFYYGQRHAKEQQAAQLICDHYQLPAPRQINLAQAFATIGGSSLTSGLVRGNPSVEAVERTESDLPPTFVPGRNLVFLSIAAAIGYVEKTYDLVGGWNAVDYSGYPDCREAFFGNFTYAANEALGFVTTGDPAIRVHTPLVKLTKEQIILLGRDLSAPLELTWSCYAGGSKPCGECDSCVIRINGFAAAGLPDPALVAGL